VRAFEHFYDVERARVVALVYAVTGSWPVAEDVAQEAFTRALTRWDKVSRFDRPGAWVRTVAVNVAHSRRRRRSAERRAQDRVGPPAVVVEDPTPMPYELERFWEEVRALPRQQRLAVALFYLEDLRPREMAEILGCSPATARVHLHRARARLQQRMVPSVLEEQQ